MLQKTVMVLLLGKFLALEKMAQGNVNGGPVRCSNNGDCGERLFLTGLLNKTNVLAAQQAAKVHFQNIPTFQQVLHTLSYSGFFTVNETIDSNIFFWFFPAETNAKHSPVLLWLEGGPGVASTQDIFFPSGPFLVENLKLIPGPNRWTQNFNVLYLDSPVGAGFSFTKNISGFARSQKDYTRDLYTALSQFFLLFPDHRSSDFYIAGISYAGKYIPALAYEIHQRNPTVSTKINLKGIAIGNGLVNPLIQVGYSKFLNGISLIDSETKPRLEKIEDEVRSLILNQEYKAAATKFNDYLFTNNGTESIMVNVTGVDVDDYLTSYTDEESYGKIDEQSLAKIFAMPELRKGIHVGSQDYWMRYAKYDDYLHDDIVQSTTNKLQVLMDNYRVVLYSGQLDIICNYRLMIDYITELKWRGAREYRNATRYQWRVAGKLAGYSKSAGNFTEVLVRNAGHMAHLYQPSWTFDLLKRLARNTPFYDS